MFCVCVRACACRCRGGRAPYLFGVIVINPVTACTETGMRARAGGAQTGARRRARARAPRWPRWPLRRCALVCGESECGLNVCGVWCRDGVRVRDHARGSVPLVRGAAVYFILYAIYRTAVYDIYGFTLLYELLSAAGRSARTPHRTAHRRQG